MTQTYKCPNGHINTEIVSGPHSYCNDCRNWSSTDEWVTIKNEDNIVRITSENVCNVTMETGSAWWDYAGFIKTLSSSINVIRVETLDNWHIVITTNTSMGAAGKISECYDKHMEVFNAKQESDRVKKIDVLGTYRSRGMLIVDITPMTKELIDNGISEWELGNECYEEGDMSMADCQYSDSDDLMDLAILINTSTKEKIVKHITSLDTAVRELIPSDIYEKYID